jgi:ribonuclease HII
MTNEWLELDITEEEWQRLQFLNQYENEARLKGYQYIAGIDEAGRGPLAGPVVAAACIIPQGVWIPYVNDSKKLSPKVRASLFERIKDDRSILYGIGIVSSAEIDQINIYQATIQAMLMAVSQLAVGPDCLLVDGMNLPHPSLPCTRIVKGDALSQSVAAASIIAKETRDELMCYYHERWPQYGFNQHKGYGTAQHLEALHKHGPCDIHRRSFEPCKIKDEVTS